MVNAISKTPYRLAGETISNRPSVIGRVSCDEVLSSLRTSDLHGKHGRVLEDWWYTIHNDHFLIRSPANLLDGVYYNSQTGDRDMNRHNEERIAAYMAMATEPPPLLLSYNQQRESRGIKTAFISNGNHRHAAACLSGRTSLTGFMDMDDWRRWMRTMAGDGLMDGSIVDTAGRAAAPRVVHDFGDEQRRYSP